MESAYVDEYLGSSINSSSLEDFNAGIVPFESLIVFDGLLVGKEAKILKVRWLQHQYSFS